METLHLERARLCRAHYHHEEHLFCAYSVPASLLRALFVQYHLLLIKTLQVMIMTSLLLNTFRHASAEVTQLPSDRAGGSKPRGLPRDLLHVTPCFLSAAFNYHSLRGGSAVRNFGKEDPRRASCKVVGHLLLEVFELNDALLRTMWGILG